MKQEIQKRIDQIKSRQVPDGYKRTSSGIFPCDWTIDKTLADIGTFGKGRGIPGDKLIKEGVPCIGYGDIYMKYNSFHFEKAESFTDEETAAESQPISKGTLLFTATGETADEIGKCICYNGDEIIYAGGDIITYNTEIVNPLFLAYQQYQPFSLKKKASFGQGHSVVHIHKDNLENLSVAYPKDSQEQEKIVQILMTWDKAIELQEKYLDGIELKKKAVIQRLIIPQKDWIRTPLDKVLRERKTYSEDNGSFIHVTLCKDGVVDKTERYERDFLVKDEEKRYKITCLKDICYNPANLKFGVICVNKYGTAIFSPIYVTFEVCTNYDVDFIGAVLTSANFIRYIRKYEEGSIYERQAVKAEDFLLGYISVPRLSVQKEIAKTISKMEQVVSFQKQKLDKLKRQRKSLQQLLLTGIVRV